MSKLAGIRVLDMSSFLPGPYLSLALSDHGAEVIKVELPGLGDHGRHIGAIQQGASVFFRNINRGKKSIALNLKDKSDLDRFYSLVETADIVIESNRPGVAARLGVDYDTLTVRNPRLIYCAISAFGQDGPLAGRPAHDLALEAITGVLANNMSEKEDIALPAIPIADYLAGLQGLAAVLMALYRRTATGEGDFIDVSMQEAMLAATLNVMGPTMAENRQPVPSHERTTGGSAFYRIYQTKDGRQLVLAGQEAKFIDALLNAIDRPDLAPLCATPGPHQMPVVDALRDVFSRLTLSDAAIFLDNIDVCWGPVNSFPEALEDAQVKARKFIIEDADGIRHIHTPIRFRNEPARPSFAVPELDQHSVDLIGRRASQLGLEAR